MKKIMKMMKFKVLFDKVVVSANKENMLNEKIDIPEGMEEAYNDIQTILALGRQAKECGLRVGQKVCIDPSRFIKRKTADNSIKNVGREYYQVEMPIEVINNEEYMFIGTRDIKYVLLDEII